LVIVEIIEFRINLERLILCIINNGPIDISALIENLVLQLCWAQVSQYVAGKLRRIHHPLKSHGRALKLFGIVALIACSLLLALILARSALISHR